MSDIVRIPPAYRVDGGETQPLRPAATLDFGPGPLGKALASRTVEAGRAFAIVTEHEDGVRITAFQHRDVERPNYTAVIRRCALDHDIVGARHARECIGRFDGPGLTKLVNEILETYR